MAKRNNEILTTMVSYISAEQAGTPMAVPGEAKVSFVGDVFIGVPHFLLAKNILGGGAQHRGG